MSLRQIIGFVFVLVSLGLLVPGLTQEMITISASFKFLAFEKEILRESRSILGTVKYLWEANNPFVASLIFLFSVAIPVLKAILLAVAFAIPEKKTGHRLFQFVQNIGKWSMADVFVVSIFIAFLSTEGMAEIKSQIEPGFYWFTGYCLTSLISLQILKWNTRDSKNEN